MIRTILVDDEKDNILLLQHLLETYCPQVSIVGVAEGVDSAMQLIRTTKPELAFLDAEMIHGNAFDLLNQLLPLDFQVVFVTAFDAYALRAFKYSAVDYLLKPVDVTELRRAVEKVAVRFAGGPDMSHIINLLENVNAHQQSQQKMALPTVSGLSFVAINDIVRLESDGNYTNIYTTSGGRYMVARNIKDYEDLLPETIFCRIHASHIINLQKIEKYQKGRGGYVTMEDGSSIEVASRRRQDFLDRLLK